MAKESGTTEKSNRGIMRKQLETLYLIFHSSSIPVFHKDPIGG
jgi:hypothetical protein